MAEEMSPRATTRPDPDPTSATRELVEDRVRSLTDFTNARLNAIEAASLSFREDLTRVPTTLDKALSSERAFNDAQILRVREHSDSTFAVITEKFLTAAHARELMTNGVIQKIDAVHDIVTANKLETDSYREVVAEQTRKNSTDVDAAVKAAFAASTLAVTQQNIANALASDKQGAAFTKDIEKLTVSLAQIQKSSDDKLEEVRKNNDQRVNDIKDRIGQMEARTGISDPATAAALVRMSEAISHLSTTSNRGEGAAKANSDNSAWIFSIIAVAVAIGTMVINAVSVHNPVGTH